MTTLAILDRTGLVHRVDPDQPGCSVIARATVRKAITPLQALVYHLPGCGRPECFPQVDIYQRIIHGRTK